MVTNLPLGKSSTIRRFSFVSTSPGVQQASANERNIPLVADIKSAAAVPLPETSASTSPQRPSSRGMKSYQSPPTTPAGLDNPAMENQGRQDGALGGRASWLTR